MSTPADFPPIVIDELAFTGPELLEDVSRLADEWAATERRLVALSRDPEFLFLVGAGDADAIGTRGRRMLRETRIELDDLVERTRLWANEAVPSRVGAGASAATASAQAQGLAASIGGALGVVNTQSIRALVDDIMIDAGFSASSSLQTMQRYIRRTQQTALDEAAINQALIISEARLENLDQRAKRLRREFSRAVGGGRFVNVRGRYYRLDTYARVVARTRLAEAATIGSFNAITAMGVDLVKVSDHGPTDGKCDPFAGKVYSISGRDARFPVLRQRPPFHPNCRHALLPFIAELKSPNELRFALARTHDEIGPGVSIAEFLNAA